VEEAYKAWIDENKIEDTVPLHDAFEAGWKARDSVSTIEVQPDLNR
jgi:hypothetical protein